MSKLCILGAGLSGLSCAYHYSGKSVIYETKSNVGGTASSIVWNGFTFDHGPHVSFTNDEYVKNLFAETAKENFLTQKAYNSNYYKGNWIRHPAICNLCDFPNDINGDILLSFLENKNNESPPQNYKQWCEQAQGKYFAEHFTNVYTEKFWTVKPETLTSDWAGDRVARPNLKRVIDGSLGLQNDSGHYFTEFRYPRQGGYGAYSDFWKSAQEKIELKLGHEVVAIDLGNKELCFKNGNKKKYNTPLISSIPLPEFINLVKNAPNKVKEAASQLQCTSIALINIALTDSPKLPYHWLYIYDADILTTRVTIYTNLSPGNSPNGCTALQAEVPFSYHRPLPKSDITKIVLDELSSCGIIDLTKVLKAWQVNIKYGYVIYDFNRENAVNVIHSWMRSYGIEPVGRFGLWQYLWSDQAVKSGKRLANSLISK